MAKKIKILSIILLAFCLLTSASIALAQTNSESFTNDYFDYLNSAGQSGTYDVNSQGNESFINPWIAGIISTIIGLIGLFFLIIVVTSGIQWMTAGGNEDIISKAKKRVINGIIGLIVTLAAFLITNFIYNYLDETFLKQTTPVNNAEEL